jgi:hypothetical protein
MARPTTNPTVGQDPSRRMTLILQMAREAGAAEPIEREDFIRYCQADPERLFEVIYHRMDEYMAEINNLEQLRGTPGDEIETLREQIQTKDEAIADLIEERNRFRDAFTRQALRAHEGNTPGASPAPEARKTAKIPDPPILTDGKDPKFEDWLLRMEDKLAANADHYATPAMRLAYVKSRCGGRAAEHIVARSRSDAANLYRDSIDIFEHLKTIFQDVNRVLNAKGKFRRLFMKNNDKFQDFLSDFSYLAQESGLADSEWKEELYYKLTAEMQRLVIRESNDANVGFPDFTITCSQTSNRLEQINFNEQRSKGRAAPKVPVAAPNTTPGHQTAKAPSTASSGSQVPGTRMNPEDRSQLMKEGKCFECKQPGHVSRNCPFKKQTAELKALEPPTEKEATPSKEPENEHP